MDSTGSALLCIVLHTCGSRVVNLFDEESVEALVARIMGENRSGVQGNEETTLVLRRGRGSCQNRPMAQPIVVVCPCDERLSILSLHIPNHVAGGSKFGLTQWMVESIFAMFCEPIMVER